MLKAISCFSVLGKISLRRHFILAFLAGIMFSAIYMYILTIITFISAGPRTYMLQYLVRYSFRITLSSHSLQVWFFFQQFTWIGYCNWNQLLYFPHESRQRPWKCMFEYWCLSKIFFSIHFLLAFMAGKKNQQII